MIRVYSGSYALYVALLVGTMTGLISKYCLDKKFIFAFFTRSQRHNLKTFIAYAVTGVLTPLYSGVSSWVPNSGLAEVSTLFRRCDRTGHWICCKVSTRQPDGFCLTTDNSPVHGRFGKIW